MGRPWKRIAIDFGVAIASLVAARQLRRVATEDVLRDTAGDSTAAADGDHAPVRLEPGWAIFGFVTSIAWTYVNDADVWKFRSSRGHRFTLYACWSVLAYRYLPNDSSTTYSISIGNGIGTLCYRFWYGIVRPNRAG